VDVYAEGEWVEFMSVSEGGGQRGLQMDMGPKVGGWAAQYLALYMPASVAVMAASVARRAAAPPSASAGMMSRSATSASVTDNLCA
jgi:hypothetical protein